MYLPSSRPSASPNSSTTAATTGSAPCDLPPAGLILSEGGIRNRRVHLEDVMNTEQAHHPIHRTPWSSDQAHTTRQAVPLLGFEQRGDTWKPEEGHPVAVDDDGRVRGQ